MRRFYLCVGSLIYSLAEVDSDILGKKRCEAKHTFGLRLSLGEISSRFMTQPVQLLYNIYNIVLAHTFLEGMSCE